MWDSTRRSDRFATLRRFVAPALLAVASGSALAQASMVPTPHPVYDWLQYQRVAGRLPTYQHEVRPMSRATIVGHLTTLAAMEGRLSRGERNLLDDFRNEFEMERLVRKRGWSRTLATEFPRSIARAIKERHDPVLLARGSDTSLVSGAVYGALGGSVLSLDDTAASSKYATSQLVRAFFNTSYGVGWHFEYDNLYAAQSPHLIRRIPRYNTEALKINSDASEEYESFVSLRARRWFEAYMGWGGQALGAAIADPLVLRPDATPFPSMRVYFGGPRLNLVALHGALRSANVLDSSGTPSVPVYNRSAPERFFASHRLTWMPHQRLSLVVHEQTVYANRGPDLTYLNPLVPMLLTQERVGDRDNLMVGGDAIYRPRDGTEITGAFLLDDRSAVDPAAPTFGPFKKVAQLGVEQQLLTGVRLGVGYTWTDPWAYTHWIALNTWESGGKPLGPVIGPNSEELAVRLTAWLPFRTRLMAGYRRAKRGLDPAAADTNTSLCVGGNLLCGTLAKESPRFQGADVHVVGRVDLEAWTEPIRGIPVLLTVRDDHVFQGTRLETFRFVNLTVRFGY